jgi:hypothetical protein
VFVIAAAEAYRQLIGAQVLSVDGHPVDDVLAAIEALISRDNHQQVALMGRRCSAGRRRFTPSA